MQLHVSVSFPLVVTFIAYLRGAYANGEANSMTEVQTKAGGQPQTPRFTWDGCLCMEKWRLKGFDHVHVNNYCGNPDMNRGGEWCFVEDRACQARVNWGYCAPTPRCSKGTAILVPWTNGKLRLGYLEAYRSPSHVLLSWSKGSVDFLFATDAKMVTTLDGLPCLHRRPSNSTTTAQPALSMVAGLTASGNLQHFDTSRHGDALAFRLHRDFMEVLQQQEAFESAVIRVVAAIVQEPMEAVQVLALIHGSVIVVLGVVPAACKRATTADAACTRALGVARQRLEMAVWHPYSPLGTRLNATVDDTFPHVLDSAQCAHRGFLCPWIVAKTHDDAGCESLFCRKDKAQPSVEHDPLWFVTLILFGGTVPTCFCCSLLMIKLCLRICRSYRRWRHKRKVRSEACSLHRIELCMEDLPLEEDWLCSICLGELTPEGHLLLLPCKHTLHYACALEWLERKMMCPLCRSFIHLPDCGIYTSHYVESATDNSFDAVTAFDGNAVVDVHEEEFEACAISSLVQDAEEPPLPHAVVDSE